MSDHSDLIARLRAACVGHPSASIAWPHRVLHEAADALSSQPLSLSEAREALRHYADTFCELGTDHECCGKLNDDQCSGCRARKALENGPAVLADAHTNPADTDLSSLRKGAEDMREALRKIAFLRPAGPTRNKLAMQMERIAIDALGGPGSFSGAALVSGSREDGDG